MNKPLKLSPSSLSLFTDCPLCFWLAFKKNISQPSGIFPSLPGGMDHILKAHFDRFRPKLPPELKELKGTKLFNKMELLSVWRNNFKGISYEDKKLGATLRGAVDEILVKDEKLIVLDFKTRGFPLKEDTHTMYQDQMNIYTYLLEKNGFDVEHFAYLLFYHPVQVNEDGSVLFQSDLKKVETHPNNARKLFCDAVECLKSEEPPAAAEDCGHCMYIEERKG